MDTNVQLVAILPGLVATNLPITEAWASLAQLSVGQAANEGPCP